MSIAIKDAIWSTTAFPSWPEETITCEGPEVCAIAEAGRIKVTTYPICAAASASSGVRWVIENAATHAKINLWQNTRGAENNTLLWFREKCLVALGQRRDYWLLRTDLLHR